MFAWLAKQEPICASSKKEPHYWCAPDGVPPFCGPGYDDWVDSIVTDSGKYDALFHHKRGLRGEASTGYLYDQAALLRMHHACPDCKIIVILREPVSRMHAAYRHLLRDGVEPAGSFDAALDAEEARIAAGWGPLFHYRSASRYYEPLKACFEIFGRASVMVLFFEDLITTPQKALEEVAQFLKIEPTDWTMPHENEGAVVKRPLLRKTLMTTIQLAKPVARSLPVSRDRHLGAKMLNRVNRLTTWKPVLPSAQRLRLQDEYRNDVSRLESLLGRPVPSSWFRAAD